MDARSLLAVVLGVLLGGFFLLFPGTAFRLRAVGRNPTTGRGPYGTAESPPAWVYWLIRLLGVVCLGVALAILVT